MEKMKSIPPHADTTLLKALNECTDILNNAVDAHEKMACVFAQIADRYLDVIDSEAAWAWERESIQTLLEVVRDYMNDAHDNVSTAHQMALGLSKEERERLVGE